MRYLNPNSYLTFKRVFGEHPDIVMSFLNALLPLERDKQIVEIEYMAKEMMPEIPLRQDSFLNVCCTDSLGGQFLVQILMDWFTDFNQYVKLKGNDSRAYLRALASGDDYKLVMPVYSLNFIHEDYDVKLEGYYHHYPIVQVEHSDKVIKGLQIVLIERPKFKTDCCYEDRSLCTLWLRFLEEITENIRYAPEELLAVAEINMAVDCLEKYKFSDGELYSIDKFWDTVRVNSCIREDREGQFANHFEAGRAKERIQESINLARKLKK